jgi:hypothetical protein
MISQSLYAGVLLKCISCNNSFVENHNRNCFSKILVISKGHIVREITRPASLFGTEFHFYTPTLIEQINTNPTIINLNAIPTNFTCDIRAQNAGVNSSVCFSVGFGKLSHSGSISRDITRTLRRNASRLVRTNLLYSVHGSEQIKPNM